MLFKPSSGGWNKPRSESDYVQPVKYDVKRIAVGDDDTTCIVTVTASNAAHLTDYKHRLSQLDATALESVRQDLLSAPQGCEVRSQSWTSAVEGHLKDLLEEPYTVTAGDPLEKYKKHEICNFSWFHNKPDERSIKYDFKLGDTDQVRAERDSALISALIDGTEKVGVLMGIEPCYQPSYADATARMPIYRLYGTDRAGLETTAAGLKSWLNARGWAVDEPTFRPGPNAKISQINADDEWEKDVSEFSKDRGISTCSVESRQLASLDEVPGLDSVTSVLPPTPRDGQSRVDTARSPPYLTHDGVVVFEDITDV